MKYLLLLLFPLLLSAQSNFDKAQRLFDDGKYEQSKPIFEALLKSNPSSLKIIENLGDIAGNSKSWTEAISYYKKLKELNPSEADYFYKYGGATGMLALEVNKFKALGMIDEIRESFEKAIELDSKHIKARWALIEYFIELPRIVGGSEAKAIVYSNELMKLSPIDGCMSRGKIEEHYKRYKEAEGHYKKAIAIGNSIESYQMLANLYKNKMKDAAKASAISQKIKDLNSTSKKNI